MNLVYSTDSGRLCPQCERPVIACVCKYTNKIGITNADNVVRLQRQTQGRAGKPVIVITGLALPPEQLKKLAKLLKRSCGSGGTVKDGVIEIQGDHRTTLKAELERWGFKVKLTGG
ncbi:MAG TPA: translation initiation factor Sui1 [Spongiibacteraceae bacterium]|jgi:translation initiation factor 1